jgi:hypothetical protein
MSMIFPGMDPYLEDSLLWPGVHNRFVVYVADQLGPRLGPRYVAAVEERVYLEGADRNVQPDVSVRRVWRGAAGPAVGVALAEPDDMIEVFAPPEEISENYVTILDLRTGQKIVTVIEVVSLANKYGGPGRASYKAKQAEVLASDAHLVEIDLLRNGPHVLAVQEHLARGRRDYDYLACTNRADSYRARFELYPRSLVERLPRIRVPLADPDPDVVLDIQAVLEQTYDAGRYRERIDYSKPCKPPLSPEQQSWADARIRESADAH